MHHLTDSNLTRDPDGLSALRHVIIELTRRHLKSSRSLSLCGGKSGRIGVGRGSGWNRRSTGCIASWLSVTVSAVVRTCARFACRLSIPLLSIPRRRISLAVRIPVFFESVTHGLRRYLSSHTVQVFPLFYDIETSVCEGLIRAWAAEVN